MSWGNLSKIAKGENDMTFAHLHTHSDASKDGLREVSQLVKAAKNYGFTSLAITDHGSLANAVSFALECKTVGIKSIIGLEAYVKFDGKTGHLTLLGHGQSGLENLIRLNNKGHAGSTKAPEFSLDDLLADCKDIICLSGCVASPFNQLPYSEAVALTSKFKHVFGNRFFMEMMFVADTDTWSRPIKLAERGNIPLVVTNDVHFPLHQDASIHQLVTKMRAGFSYNSSELWLKPEEQIWKRAKRFVSKEMFDEAVGNVSMIVGKIKSVEFNSEPTLPHIPNADKELVSLVNRYSPKLPTEKEYKKRIAYELQIISKMDYSSYFVILHDIVDGARKLGAYVGPGRGSGAGSLVLYTLGITDIDPIRYELPFERFLNPQRKGMPDVDVDIDSQHRDVVIDYVAKRWNGVPIGTVVRYSHKTVVHDLSKALKIPRPLENEIAEKGPTSTAFKRLVEEDKVFAQAYDTIMGQIRHRGRHAAGVVITDRSVPIERASGNLVAAWTQGKLGEMEKAGIVKYDLLGLEALTILNILEKQMPKEAARSKIHEDGDKAFELFQKGDLSGVFQFSGSFGIRALTMKLSPTKFDDLTALNALYRPGALDAGTADKFVEWRHSPRKVPAIIEDILAPTYGAIVYQEQVMSLYARMTKGTFADADTIRRIIVKAQDKFDDPEWQRQFEEIRTKFVMGAIHNHGISEVVAKKIWDEIATHSRYSFNKAHSTAYAQIAWQMAYWKYYHPVEFYAAMMSSDRENLTQYIFEVINRGIKVRLPTVNQIGDNDRFIVDGDSIIIPANVIKYVTNVAPIRDELKKGPFKSIEDFMARVPRNAIRGQARASLVGVGAFKGIPGSLDKLGISGKSKEMLDEIKRSSNPEREAQLRLLGFIIPTKSEIKKIEEASKDGLVTGIIAAKKEKKSGFGPYTVYYLIPQGLFWTRGLRTEELRIGDFVAAKIRPSSGKATMVRKL
jgi:DNA polymerase III subunit alpha